MRVFLLAAVGAVFGCVMQAHNAVVLKPAANMHSGPSDDTDVVSQAIYGWNVEVLETRDSWAKVRTADEYTGWVHTSALLNNDTPYAAKGRIAEVTSIFANLYRETSITKHAPVLTVPFETRLEVVDEKPEGSARYIRVRLPDDRAAYVQRGDITLEPGKVGIGEMIAMSKQFLGLPYLWAGTSSFGYDCSGFTQMLCRRRGIVMPRDAHLQAAWSGVTTVAKEELAPGDLLFFGPNEKKITHTGMYIGDGEFIHATSTGRPMIQISKLDEPHWAKLLVACRRPK